VQQSEQRLSLQFLEMFVKNVEARSTFLPNRILTSNFPETNVSVSKSIIASGGS